jgi:hypothetical protein
MPISDCYHCRLRRGQNDQTAYRIIERTPTAITVGVITASTIDATRSSPARPSDGNYCRLHRGGVSPSNLMFGMMLSDGNHRRPHRGAGTSSSRTNRPSFSDGSRCRPHCGTSYLQNQAEIQTLSDGGHVGLIVVEW